MLARSVLDADAITPYRDSSIFSRGVGGESRERILSRGGSEALW